MLENSKDAKVREMHEEIGVEVNVHRLLWVVENFFEYNERSFHELGLYFQVSFPQESGVCGRDDVLEGDEDGLKIYFKWFPSDEQSNVMIVPSFLQTELKSIPDTPVHIIHAGP